MKPLLMSLLFSSMAFADSTIDPSDKFAYGANVGWVNCRGDGPGGVVFGERFLSGFAYGANVGWISFGSTPPNDGIAYQNDSAGDFGVNHDGYGNLSGFAYGAAIGWINFGWAGANDPNRPRVNLQSGEFAGFAYSASCGWINLGAGYLKTDSMSCVDDDGDGIADWWELTQFGDLGTATATSNFDGDQASDLAEYHALTDPIDPHSFFQVTVVSVTPIDADSEDVELEFTTSLGRLYEILRTPDLIPPYADSGLGIFAPDSDTTSTRTLTTDGDANFFKVGVLKPLQP